MEISSFVVRTILLMLPGIVSIRFYRKLRGKCSKKDWEDFADIIIFSILSYMSLAFIKAIFPEMKFIDISIESFYNDNIAISWTTVFCALLAGIVLAYIASYFYKKKTINKIGKNLGVTNRYGDEDVWDYFHNMDNYEWVVVRDHKQKLYYYCWIKTFSETNEKRELLLSDVSVYNEEGEYCYDVEAMYISRDEFDLTIEIPKIKEEVVKE
jgi:hypothetical protein